MFLCYNGRVSFSKGMNPMANKKSAKSKGYRKTVEKKPYVTKKELIITGVIAAIIILVVVLFNIFYDDGSLPMVDGAVVTEGQNSLVATTGYSTDTKYFKLGQLADVEGYTLSSVPAINDANLAEYTYTPNEESAIDDIIVNAYTYDYKLLGESTRLTLASVDQVSCDEEMTATKINGLDVIYFIYNQERMPAEDAEEATVEISEYMQSLSAYINVGKERTIVVHVRNAAASEDEYVDNAVLVDALNEILPAISYETK